MPISETRAWLVQKRSFQKQIDDLVVAAVAREFPQIKLASAELSHDWEHLLLCGSLLARSDKTEEQRIALRIADTCLQSATTSPEERAAAAVLLDMMANRRTIALATKRQLIPVDLETSLPLPLRGDFQRRTEEDSITGYNAISVPVNRFQGDFWRACREVTWVSASAPTSAGKSFLLKSWVIDFFRSKPKGKIVFVVPTRALIQEVSNAFAEDQQGGDLAGVIIHTLPLETNFAAETGHLFVFTQERLHILLGREPEFTCDALIVDEAHKVGDGQRGVLLEQVVHECVRRNQGMRVIFAAPHAANPRYLLRDAPSSVTSSSVDRDVTTVSQNLLFVSQKAGKPTIWHVDYRDGDKALRLGDISLVFRPTSTAKRMTAVAFSMRAESGNLIYANGQAEAEKFAMQLVDAYVEAGADSLAENPRIIALTRLVERTIHRNYRLKESLVHGVAFHYGNMPLLVRLEIEALFRDNILRFLVCTSTLMEGVNLPCKVIFMRGPKKGRLLGPLSPSDFWNLAGRAGRWGTEFQGSIVCIDPHRADAWKTPPPVKRVRQVIQSSTDASLNDPAGLLPYAEQGFPFEVGQGHPDYDYSASFLLSVLARGDALTTVPVFNQLTPNERVRLETILQAEIDQFELPKELIFRNPGVLPRAMTQLRDHFRTLTPEAFAEMIPVLPESEDAVTRYNKILEFINTFLRANFARAGAGANKRLTQLSFLTVDWMRGRPLAVIIKTRERINSRKEAAGIQLSALIREVMGDVEEYARFKIPRYLRCYLGVLTVHAEESNLSHLVEDLPDLELWLELGVSVKTALSLMELGLSRTSAVEIFELMTNTEMTPNEVLAWLRARNIDTLEIPSLMQDEIRKMLARQPQSSA